MYMDPIDISSSDSEDEIFQPTRNGISFQLLPSASVVPRKLPTWASPFNLNSNIIVRHSTSTPLRNSNDIINDKASNQHGSEFTQREELIQEYTERVSAAFSNVVNSKCLPESSIDHIPVIEIRASAPSTSFQMTQGKLGPNLEHEVKNQLNFTKTSDGNDEWGVEYNHFESPEHSVSQNMAKRILPHSFQTSISISEKQIEGGNQYVHGNDTNLLVSAKKRVLEENDDDIMIYEKFSPGRHLPSSLVHGKSAINLKPVSSSAAPYHSRIVEDGPIQNDERLIFQTAVQDLSQPRLEVDVPDGLLNVALLRHQKIALAWMLQKETTVFPCLGGILADDQGLGKTISTIALIQMQMSLQSKHTSGTPHDIETEPLNLEEDDGSILESNGLKKTTEEDVLNNHTISDTKKNNFHKGRPTAGTLVVCPASVLWQWARELDEKITNAAKLSVLIYHGNRTKDPSELATYDVVLTTYSIVTNEVPKQPLVDDADAERKAEKYGLYSDFIGRKKKECNEGKKGKKNRKGNDGLPVDPESGPLAKVGWFRVVLDEAQTIKNHRTLVARACSTLRAKRRWCLSGTPIQNTIDDLYSYFRFLRYDPYSVYKCFCLSIKYPITRNSACGYKKLQAILKTIMLRRTKETIIDGESIIKLPKKSIYLKKVDFTEEERTFYTRLEADSRSQFKKYAAEGTVTQNYANILLMLLRLRQACDHPLLVKDCLSHSVGQASLTMAKTLPREKLSSLLNELEGSLPICGVCNDPPEDAIVTICGHVFCYQCVSEYLTGDVTICPSSSCKEQLGTDLVFSKTILRNCIYGVDGDHATNAFGDTEGVNRVSPFATSSKIRAVMEILQSFHKINSQSSNLYFRGHNKECNTISDNFLLDVHDKKGINENQRNIMPEKAIVFSQWTGMLDLVESSLNNSFIQYRRLDGSMSLASRDKAVKDFTNNPQVTVMIMSLKAGNLGLNLVAANHVILLDLWWNPTTEDQAVDRAHRIGQTRPVTVSRLTIKDTVEDRILALQEEKRKMVSSAFGEDQSGNVATRLTVDDLRYLFMV